MAKKNILAESVKVEYANPQPCCCEATFTFAADAVKAEKSKVVSYIGGVARLPGFRAGKAPAGLVASKFAGEIKEELRNRIMGAAFAKIEENKDLEILTVGFKTQPDMEQEGDITFTLNMNTAPAIDLGDYNAITVELPQDAVSDEMIEERLKLYHTMYGSFADVEEPAKADDMLKVNYSSDFELPEDASPSLKRRVACEDTFLMLSEPESIPGAIAALTGAEKGREYTIAATFGDDCGEDALKGKTVNYKVSVLAVQRRKELTDEELLEKIKMDSIDELRKVIRQGLERDSEAKRRQEAAEAVFKKLDEAAGEFDMPPALLDSENAKELQNIARTTVRSEADAEKFKAELDEHKKTAEAAARVALRRRLILSKLAKLENLTISDAELNDRITGMSYYYGMKPAEMRTALERNGAIEELRMEMAAEGALEKLVAKVLK